MVPKWLIGVAIVSVVVGLCRPVSCGQVTLDGTVFNNVVVAISSSIESNSNDIDAMNQIVEQIRMLMTSTSNTLYSATGNRLTFGKTIILGPANWSPSPNKQKRDTSVIPVDQATFDNADIRVDVANLLYGDLPYTQQSRFCQERGDFIHITLNFIKGTYSTSQYGTPDKLLAREWVKYFFGVFDEQGYAYNNMYPVKYFAPGAMAILNSCNNTQVEWNNDSCYGQGPVQGLPSYCELQADQNNGRNAEVNTSMMSLPLTPITTQFCSNESGHNADAPNMQNVMCDGQSIMGVILQHPQLKGLSPTEDTPPNQPTFTEQMIDFTNVMSLGIIWDNMAEGRTTYSAWPSLAKFITYDFPLQAYIAFQQTTTSTGATNTPFHQLNATSDITNLVSMLDPPAFKTTSSMSTAFNNMISMAKNQPSNVISAFVVITENSPAVSDWKTMCDSAKQINTQLHLISYSASSVTNFINAGCTGRSTVIQTPNSPYDSTVWDKTVQDCYKYLYERNQFDDFIRALPNVIAPAVYGPPQTFYDEIHFNSTMSSFYVTEPTYSDIMSMTDRFYYESCLNLNGYSKISSFLKCRVNNILCGADTTMTMTSCASNIINSTEAENKFSCNVTAVTINGKSQLPPYSVYAVGQPANSIVDPKYPQITLKQWVVADNPTTAYTRVRIFARLVLGTTPVFNANVTATMVTNSATITIQLRDDGSGNPDVVIKDGIYSAYFTQFGSTTSYSVTVTATDNNLVAVYPTKTHPWISNVNDYGVVPTGPFTRVGSADSFYVSNWGGSIEPGRIMDLRVQSTDSQSVTLQWTAPGKDFDYGQADSYLIKCSDNRNDLIGNNFDPNEGQASNIPLVWPKQPGQSQSVTINDDAYGITRYCAIRTSDGSIYSDPSNIATYSIIPSDLTIQSDQSTPSKASMKGQHLGFLWVLLLLYNI